MRKVVYSLTNSLDNFIAREDGGAAARKSAVYQLFTTRWIRRAATFGAGGLKQID